MNFRHVVTAPNLFNLPHGKGFFWPNPVIRSRVGGCWGKNLATGDTAGSDQKDGQVSCGRQRLSCLLPTLTLVVVQDNIASEVVDEFHYAKEQRSDREQSVARIKSETTFRS